jgi:hypothetical protein
MRDPDDYPRPPLRRRLLVALMAVAMMAFLVWAVTRKSGVVRDAALHPADVAACTAGQTEGCVGGRAAVFAVPPATAASR